MKPDQTTAKRIFGVLTAFTAWFAIIFQWVLTTESFTNFMSYFTILTNLLVALCLNFSLFFPLTKAGRYFSKPTVQTAIALYIFIVALVYNLVLRGIWAPQGWQFIVDNLLHVVVPVLYICYWVFFVAKGSLTWKDGFYWIVFPFIYLVYSLLRGTFVHWYPYSFLNVDQIGYAKAFVNIGIMLVVFLVAGIIVIASGGSAKSIKKAR